MTDSPENKPAPLARSRRRFPASSPLAGRRIFSLLSFAALLLLLALAAYSGSASPAVPAGADAPSEPGAPLMFVENEGQFPPEVHYQVRTPQGILRLAGEGLLWALPAKTAGGEWQAVSVRWHFPGANWSRPEPLQPVETTVTYFTPDGLFSAVPVWSGVRYAALYPGLDLEIDGTGGRLTIRFQVTDEAAYQAARPDVRLQVDGATPLRNVSGGLALDTALGERVLPLSGTGREFELTLSSNGPSRQITLPAAPPAEDESRPVQATTLLYSTYAGGTQDDWGNDILFHTDGFAYAIGEFLSVNDFPGPFGRPVLLHDIDSYVAKLLPDGSGFVYMFHIVAEQEEAANGIALSSSGDAYVAGRSSSPDFPTTPGAYDTTPNGEGDAWVLKLNSSGTAVQYSTMLGTTLREWIWDIDIDAAGNAFVTGQTNSPDFPTTAGAFDNTYNGNPWDAFVAIFNNSGSQLLYSSFLGSSQEDIGEAIQVGPAGDIYVAGHTTGLGSFPNTIQYGPGGGADAFVAHLAPGGSSAVYIAGLGGGANDRATDMVLDANGRLTVSGYAASADFPTTPGAFDTTHAGSDDAFALRLPAGGAALDFSTFLGGGGPDRALGLALDNAGNTYLTGATGSGDFPTTPNAYDATPNGNLDVFVAKLNAAGSALSYGTFIGGVVEDYGQAIAVEAEDLIYVTGFSKSPNFPVTPGAFDTIFNGDYDVIILKLQIIQPPTPTPTATNTPTSTPGPSPTPTATFPSNFHLPVIKRDE